MAVVVDATIAGIAANSYATLTEADAYMASRPLAWSEASRWENADPDDKNRALVTATAMLDEYIEWHGYAASQTQALAWPRSGLTTPNGFYQLNTEIPALVKRATCELASQLLGTNRGADSDAEVQGLKGLTAGPVSLQFRDTTIEAKAIPDRVWRMVSLWGVLKQRSSNADRADW